MMYGSKGERVEQSMVEHSEAVAPLYLLVKDHKGLSQESGEAPPSRPVFSGNQGFNKHLSEIVYLILELLGHALEGNEIDSTGALLAEINDLNKKRENGQLDKIPEELVHHPPLGAQKQSSAKRKKVVGFTREFKEERVKRLKSLKKRGSKLPNFKSKLWAVRLLDEVTGGMVLKLT